MKTIGKVLWSCDKNVKPLLFVLESPIFGGLRAVHDCRHQSIIIPIHNGTKWMELCLDGILSQTTINKLKIEVCVCNDGSTDNTAAVLEQWRAKLEEKNISLRIFHNTSGSPRGVGYSKNRAVFLASGDYLCFQDVDDVMLPNRVLRQHEVAINLPKTTLIGSQFRRVPENSTTRYTKWANELTDEQLCSQIYTSHGPTIIMPTWFCHKDVYSKVGSFDEGGKGVPEDLIFFYRHLDLDGKLHKIPECLLTYTYHTEAATFSVLEDTIWNIRLERLQRCVLKKWKTFTIWNAGKQGRKLYNSLDETNKLKVTAMCDVDTKKIGRRYEPYCAAKRKAGRAIDIVHYKDAKAPFILCVKMDMTDGVFEENLRSLNLKEGVDYIYFS